MAASAFGEWGRWVAAFKNGGGGRDSFHRPAHKPIYSRMRALMHGAIGGSHSLGCTDPRTLLTLLTLTRIKLKIPSVIIFTAEVIG